MDIRLTIQPFNINVVCGPDTILLESIRKAGIQIRSNCGGNGTCGKCGIILIQGSLKPVGEKGRTLLPVNNGTHPACRVVPVTDCVISIPPESIDGQLKTLTAFDENLEIQKAVVQYQIFSIAPPDFEDVRSYDIRITEEISALRGSKTVLKDIAVISTLPGTLRKHDWRVKAAIVGDGIIDIRGEQEATFVLAVDIGSTKIAVYLLDPKSGRQIESTGLLNPQTSYGFDIVSRLGNAAADTQAKIKMQRTVIDAINQAAEGLCGKHGTTAKSIVHAVCVGNSAMHHLVLGIDILSLIEPPYVAAAENGIHAAAERLGFSFSAGARVYFPPNVGGFVGSDHLSMLLSAGIQKRDNAITLYVDVGTNTEICLAAEDKYYCLSAPSGPAFEGAHIEHGMRAVPGAVDTCRVHKGKFICTTIDGQKARGICGSGIVDAIAEAYTWNIIDWRGRLQDHESVVDINGSKCLVLIEEPDTAIDGPVYLSQKDIREFQLVKGAVASGIQVLFDSGGFKLEDLSNLVIAGAFGSFINAENAFKLGLFPFHPKLEYSQIGNAAGGGACLMALDADCREEMKDIRTKMEYIELVKAPGFKKTFARASYFGKTNDQSTI